MSDAIFHRLAIIGIGLMAILGGHGDVSRVLEFKTAEGGGAVWPVIAAASPEPAAVRTPVSSTSSRSARMWSW